MLSRYILWIDDGCIKKMKQSSGMVENGFEITKNWSFEVSAVVDIHKREGHETSHNPY